MSQTSDDDRSLCQQVPPRCGNQRDDDTVTTHDAPHPQRRRAATATDMTRP
ncbi:hypothetical protein K443DRAFT_10627 [Laccaria amethystina LaAM-08-1]|uniref:Uncharacterized protein n=1 Tax=Laccaria amethystina LaAM-08-1 TaxID=1095629 RepID=A0A0C9XFJ1_9AGAR|nr:hypothetical protein K443DRAFT_10627 [Laccaria amethystina LaAM-08-1]